MHALALEHVATTDLSCALPAAVAVNSGRQRFAGQRGPRAQVGGFADAAVGIVAGGPQSVGQRVRKLVTQHFRRGLLG